MMFREDLLMITFLLMSHKLNLFLLEKSSSSSSSSDSSSDEQNCPGTKDARSGIGSVGVSLSVSKSGCVSFYLTTFHLKILEQTLCLVHLIASDWSRTSAELQHRVYCTFGSAGNLLTHPAIYGSSDPQARELFGTPLSKEFHPPEKKRKHINSFQSLNDVIHWSPSTINVPSGEKRKRINSLQSLNDAIHWSPSTINVPSGEKKETHQFSPILERCQTQESLNYTRARPSCGPDRW
ncbi:hypothetical protein TNCV_3045391 [Trichonephila clavipes]|nr:hypothetical protein TNCV_3045391 [Trichonephila clavipes]